MRFSLAAAPFLVHLACAFAPQHHVSSTNNGGALKMSSPPEEFLQRSQRVKSVLEDDEKPPKLFEDDLLEDMRESLLKLETRVKEGPGALSMEQVDEFEAATQRILKEMKEFNAAAGEGAASVAPPAAPSSTVPPSSSSPPPSVQSEMKITAQAVSPKEPSFHRSMQPEEQTVPVRENNEVTDTSEDEGPAYDGTGGMGLAKGTANTYVIPGMDEMTPEEYRKALQQSVIDRQSRRHSSRGGVVGNRAAHEYLDNLGWGGASSNLGLGKEAAAAEEDVDDEHSLASWSKKKE